MGGTIEIKTAKFFAVDAIELFAEKAFQPGKGIDAGRMTANEGDSFLTKEASLGYRGGNHNLLAFQLTISQQQ